MTLGFKSWNEQTAGVDPHKAKMACIGQSFQLGTALILAPIILLMCPRLPVNFGWENGPAEMLQNFVLGFAALASVLMAVWRRGHVQRYLWLAVALLWLLLLGRELSWGAVFVPPLSFDPIDGPFYSSRALSYRPLVPWIAGGAFLVALVVLAFCKPLQALRFAWERRRLAPWGALAAVFVYGLVATFAESSRIDWVAKSQVTEEVFETVAYYFLVRAQWWSFTRWLKPSSAE